MGVQAFQPPTSVYLTPLSLAALVFVLVLLGEVSAWSSVLPIKAQIFKGATGPCASLRSIVASPCPGWGWLGLADHISMAKRVLRILSLAHW